MKTERTIRNCPLRFKPECPKLWPNLVPTPAAVVRYCNNCRKDVFFCEGRDDTVEHGCAGHIVARDEPARSELPPFRIGGLPIEPSASQELALQMYRRERGITVLLNGRIAESSRDCPSCAFPVPGFRLTCYVCAHSLGRE